MTDGGVEELAPAKVNLVLEVLARQDDGYHQLRTLFCALDLADRLEIRLRHDAPVTLEVEGPDLGPDEKNLAARAARAFLDRTGSGEGVHIRLVKGIPAGGGLGGGSSDAAATLRALDRLLPGRLTAEDAREIAARLGSDVPFFLAGAALARGEGRGEQLVPLPPLPPRDVVLALPPFGVATAAAYRWLDEDREAGLLPMPADGGADTTVHAPDWREIEGLGRNDFEGPVFRRHPVLRRLRDALVGHGAAPALLAGSGSTVFGVFSRAEEAAAALSALRRDHPDCRAVLTRTRAH